MNGTCLNSKRVRYYRFDGEWPVAELYANSVKYNSSRSTKRKEPCTLQAVIGDVKLTIACKG